MMESRVIVEDPTNERIQEGFILNFLETHELYKQVILVMLFPLQKCKNAGMGETLNNAHRMC
jgi:hypothetical protein